MKNIYDQLIGTEAGLVSGCIFEIPNRPFVPEGLYVTALEGKNLDIIGCNMDSITGGGIGFSPEQSYASSFGEFCERYSGGIINKKLIVTTSYNELIKTGENALHPDEIKLFSKDQYSAKDFPYKKLETTDTLPWVRCCDYFTKQTIYIPKFLIYFGNRSEDKKYCFQTSTGLACGDDFETAFKGAVFEIIERDAFVNFWYNQDSIEFIKYNKETVLNTFPDNQKLNQLLKNTNIQISIFDLTKFSPIESVIAFMYFKYKGKYYQTMGSASRFSKEDAIIKALLEAYQGVDYAIGLHKQNILGDMQENELHKLNDYNKHFAYYNTFPHVREEVPVLKEALNQSNFASNILFESNKLKSLEKQEMKRKNISKVFYVDVTTSDLSDIGNRIVRVVMPDFTLLSPIHSYPFLGNEKFQNKSLFTKLPHPFP